MKKFIRVILMSCMAIVLTTSLALAALTLENAKAQGLVGEQPDGLLGIVVPSAEVTQLVNGINEERVLRYQAVAVKNGIDLEQVKTLTGKKLIDGTPKGGYFMDAAGNWQKK